MRLTALFGTGLMACGTAFAGPGEAPEVQPAPAASVSTEMADAGRGFRVRLDADGRLTAQFSNRSADSGEIETIDNVRVKLIRDGRIVARVRQANNGIVHLEDVQPGTYSLIAQSPTGYVSAGVQVLPAVKMSELIEADAETRRRLDTSGIHVMLVPKGDYEVVSQFFNGSNKVTAKVAAIDSDAFGDVIQSPLRRPTLSLQEDGEAVGQVFGLDPKTGENSAVGGARVALIRGGSVVAATFADAEGRYRLTGLTEGVYTMATASDRGFSAFGVEAKVAEATVALEDAQGRKFVQFGEVYSDPCCCVEHAVICEDAIPYEPLCGEVITETIIEESLPILEEAPLLAEPFPPAAPMGGGFGGFGGGVGGGGGFGGGGFGAIAGLAGLGLGAYALSESDDDDDRRVVVDDPDPVAPGNANDFINGLTDTQLRDLLRSLSDAQIAQLRSQLSGPTLARLDNILANLGDDNTSPGGSGTEED